MELSNEFPTDLNYEWYIDKTKEILYEIGYIKHQEQLKLFI